MSAAPAEALPLAAPSTTSHGYQPAALRSCCSGDSVLKRNSASVDSSCLPKPRSEILT